MKNRSISMGLLLMLIHATLATLTFSQKNGGGLEFMWMMFFNSPIFITLKLLYGAHDSSSLLYLLGIFGSIHWFLVGFLLSKGIESIFRIKNFIPFFFMNLFLIALYSFLNFRIMLLFFQK